MVIDNTILSKKELSILETIISNLGYVASFSDIRKLLEDQYTYDEIRKQLSLLSKRGWLVRIKRGLFAVATLESHRFTNLSPLVIASVLNSDSYVSFEFALWFYGLFDQLPGKLIGVTRGKPRKFQFQEISYEFRKIKPELYFGFKEIQQDGEKANVAELEKAILDFLYFRTDTYSIDLVLEKLSSGKDDIDFKKLQTDSFGFPLSVARRLGFLLDMAGISTEDLHKEIGRRGGYNKLTGASDKFNARWRIYYEDRFVK